MWDMLSPGGEGNAASRVRRGKHAFRRVRPNLLDEEAAGRASKSKIPRCRENACAEGTLECGSAGYRLVARDSRRQLRCRSPRRFAHFQATW